MDLEAVRTFVAAADLGQFQGAADDLEVTQQAVSKRIATLEKELGVRLFTRTARGAQLTVDGQAFLPHARALLHAAERAIAAVRPDQRPLRVDVPGRRFGPARLLRAFLHARPGTELDVVTLADANAAIAAIDAGTIDASLRALSVPPRRLPAGIAHMRALDEPHQLLTGPRHRLAGEKSVTPAQLAGHRIWMPTLPAGAEWADYFDALAAAFGLRIERTHPDFGTEPLWDVIADSADIATFVGEQMQLAWPEGHDLRRIPVRAPAIPYPHSLIWHSGNPHPSLAALREHITASCLVFPPDHPSWLPPWTTSGKGARAVGSVPFGLGGAAADQPDGRGDEQCR
jgi:DNA-binding transcriptional LysR family regulator